MIGKSSTANFERFQVRHQEKAVHQGSPVHYKHTCTFRPMVKRLEYAVDALVTSRLSRNHLERCDNSCYRIKRRPRETLCSFQPVVGSSS